VPHPCHNGRPGSTPCRFSKGDRARLAAAGLCAIAVAVGEAETVLVFDVITNRVLAALADDVLAAGAGILGDGSSGCPWIRGQSFKLTGST
jgi:hypothetical protein